MANQIRCIIVDDDEIDRLSTLSLARKYPWLEVQGVYDSPVRALAAVAGSMPDLAFLDVDMPEMNGLDLRRKLGTIPTCIIITSYPEYAVESFEVAALDFIVKPLRAERFEMAMERVQSFFTVREKATLLDHSLGADTIIIKEGHEQVKLSLHEIIYLEALKDYTRLITTHGKHYVLSSLGNLLKQPGFERFVRIHKSYAVQKHFVERMKGQELTVRGIVLPVGRSFKDNLAHFN